MVVNNYLSVPKLPYKVFEYLAKNKSEEAQRLWKVLYYGDKNCLSKPNLTKSEKISLIWSGESDEEKFKFFNKPLVSSSLSTADSMTHIRLFRARTDPNTSYDSALLYEIDIFTNDTDNSLYDEDGYLVEKSDYLECLLLYLLNGKDLGIGYSKLRFDRQVARGSFSTLSLGNSKTIYGRQLFMALRYLEVDEGVCDGIDG